MNLNLSSTAVPFGVRTALAALSALWLAMWLQLDNPRWAAWTVLSLALPTRGQVGLKGLWRAGGTVLGLVAGLVGIALYAQSPIALGTFLAAWLTLNSYAAGRLPGLAAYGAALAGLTAGLVVVLSATDPLSSFRVALERSSTIVLGVACVYVASTIAEILQGSPAPTATPPAVVLSDPTVLANALRTFGVVSLAWAFWIVTAWPSGGIFVALAGSMTIVFATMPDADRHTWSCLWGVALGQLTGLFLKYGFLTATPSFGALAAALFPFLFMGGVGLTDTRTIPSTVGYNISFLLAVQPLNPMQYDLAASLNEAVAIFAGVALAGFGFRFVFPERVWRLS